MGSNKGTKDKVQLFNPRSHTWVLVDTKIGGIVGHGRKQPYKNVPIRGETPNAKK